MKVRMFFLMFVSAINLFACSSNNSKQIVTEFPFEEEDTIDKILIQFYPAFIDNSLMLLDLSKKEQTFQRIGLKVFYWKIAPKSLNFQIDTLSYSYFRNISFNEEDFVDKEDRPDDGIMHTILYVFKSGRIEDVDLKKKMTANENNLIIKMIDLSIEHSTDSITTEYLKDLRKFHREGKY